MDYLPVLKKRRKGGREKTKERRRKRRRKRRRREEKEKSSTYWSCREPGTTSRNDLLGFLQTCGTHIYIASYTHACIHIYEYIYF